MRILLQRYAYLGAYIAAPLLSLVVLWAFMQAENQRSYYYDIAGRLTEIQWRASQARENSMNALYLVV